MGTALVLGGTGFVGRHISTRLAQEGLDVMVASRGATPVPREVADLRHVQLDREEADLSVRVPDGIDVLVDVVPYETEDGLQLLRLRDQVGHIVAISTTSVYADDRGRSLDEATSEEDSPRMPVPILETQRRVEPGPATYSTKKAAIEDILLRQPDVPVTVIRPCAIYGPGDTQCREWFFVKRALDARPFVLLADEGKTVFHTTSVHNLAEMVVRAAERQVHGAFNCGDPDPPNVLEIARTISVVLGHAWEEIPVPRGISRNPTLDNPWRTFSPWIVDMTKAHSELGYESVTSYDDAVGETIEWVVGATRGREWQDVLPKAAKNLGLKFDYEAEDRFRASLA